MRRTQLYLEDDVWAALQIRSRESGLSMSELVRVAVRERYLDHADKRKQALQSIMGLWKDRADLPETEEYVRSMRRDSRRERLGS
jgi:Ribbon-helix-helix protein, copG family